MAAAAHLTARQEQPFATPAHLSRWSCHAWLFCISSLVGTPRQISKELEMQYGAYHMTRKIMKLSDSQKALTVNGGCEAADCTFMQA